MVDRLKGKVALVVGAGSIGPGWGNGKATAVAFAREGARVFCADINPDAAEETAGIIRSEGGEAVAHRADVSNAADVIAMVEVCASAYGRIDVLDNNLGIAEVGGVVEVSEADWDRVFAVNLKSAYLTMKQVIPLIVDHITIRGDGRAAIPFSQSVNSLLTREKNREFRRIRLLGAILKAGTRANSEACSQIPYTTEQGIFAKEQGIFTPEQGICLQKPKSSPDEVFGTHNAPCGATQPLGVGARHFRPPVPRSFNAR